MNLKTTNMEQSKKQKVREFGNEGAMACVDIAHIQTGLTKREYYAGIALGAMLSNPDINTGRKEIARWSVEYADDLIEALIDSVTCWRDDCNNDRMKGHVACMEHHNKLIDSED